MINLVDKEVEHESFGRGSIISYDGSYIQILFKSGKKRFVFPEAFKEYLILCDKKAASMVNKKIEKEEKEREEIEIKLEEEREARRRQYLLQKQKPTKKQRIHSRLQSVFWCKPEEEDIIFEEWKVFTGVIKSGAKKGEPRRLAQVNQNSACLITSRDKNVDEEERQILGAFMVEPGFRGGDCKDGYIPAHPKYRIRLSEEESEKMLFWTYYINKRYPDNIVWNSGKHRYFDNEWMAQILRDIINLKEDPKEQEDVKAFFDYFCQINNINKEELPEANGPLAQD